MSSILARTAVAVVVVLSLGATSCGGTDSPGSAGSAEESANAAVQECRDQWRDVAANVAGLDEDEHPSALAKRWANILATVAIYAETTTAEKCQENIETLSNGITELRQLMSQVQPYDMELQIDQVAQEVSEYLASPLPDPVRKGKKVIKPPSKRAVTVAVATLTGQAAAANADLMLPWRQLEAITISDQAAVTTALGDLDSFAIESANWVACRNALEVIKTALVAQRAAGGPTSAPTSAPTATPTPSTSASPSLTP